VLWFHGTPGGRRQVPPAARRLAQQAGARVIGVDRPGTGESTPHRHGTVRGFVGDVVEVADRLGVERFGVIGLSGGGPYALACAHDLPDRVVAAVVLGGVAPTTGPGSVSRGLVELARWLRHPLAFGSRPLGVALTLAVRALQPVGPEALELYSRLSPPGDRVAFASPAMKEMFLDDLNRAAAYHGLHGVSADLVAFGRPWDFDLADIGVPVRFWHGDADHIVPLAHAEAMSARVAGSELVVRPGESHLGTLVAGDDAVRTILDLWEGP
jgi:pimeloyl-ACP methyl ester carboxylesterase